MRKICEVEDCNSGVMARGMCSKHYQRQQANGTTESRRKSAPSSCSVEGCERPHAAFGRCDTHYRQEYKPRAPVRHEGRKCVQCDEPLASNRRITAMFCSPACKNAERVRTGVAQAATRRSYFKRVYGLTLEEVEQMAAGGCGICGTKDWNGRHGTPHVDHCHKTGQVRGILCHECNIGLGKFRDSPDLLQRAMTYLTGRNRE